MLAIDRQLSVARQTLLLLTLLNTNLVLHIRERWRGLQHRFASQLSPDRLVRRLREECVHLLQRNT